MKSSGRAQTSNTNNSMNSDPTGDQGKGIDTLESQQKSNYRSSSLESHLRRFIVVAIIIVVLSGAAIVGSHVHHRTLERSVISPWSNGTPTVAAADAYSTSWYCAGPVRFPHGGTLQVVIANTKNEAVSGTLEAVSEKASATPQALLVKPMSDLVVNPFSKGEAKDGYLGSVVTMNGGGIGVAELSKNGATETPCSSSTASNWYFPFGSTAPGEHTTILLFNPTHEPATAAVSIASTKSSYSSQTLQSITVKPMRVALLQLGHPLPSLKEAAITVTARSGQLVAFEQESKTTPGSSSTTLVLGAPSPAKQWYFPLISPGKGVSDALYAYNPSYAPARLDVVFHGSMGGTSVYLVHTVVLSNRLNVLQLNSSTLPRAIGSAPFAVSVKSTNEIPVVVGRSMEFSSSTPYGGYAIELGSLKPTTRSLLVAVTPSSGATASWLDLYDPTSVSGRGEGRSSGRSKIAGGGMIKVDVRSSSTGSSTASATSASSQQVMRTAAEELRPDEPLGTLLPGSKATVVFLVVEAQVPLVAEVDTAKGGVADLTLQLGLPFV